MVAIQQKERDSRACRILDGTHHAVCAGIGVAFLPEWLVADDLRSKYLVGVVPFVGETLGQVMLAVATTLGAAALLVIGHVADSRHLWMWGLDPGTFPKTHDWLVMNGYYAVFDRAVRLATPVAEVWTVNRPLNRGNFRH